MKALLLLFATLCATLTVHADIAVAHFDFSGAGTSNSGHNWPGEGNWSNATTKACKARINGIGIAPASASGGQSGMKYTCPEGETETIRQLTITCMASFKGSADTNKTYTLGVTFNNQEDPFKESFSFNGEIDTPHTIVFTFEEAVSASSIVITNETDQAGNTNLFEINAVSWQSDFSEISATFSAPSSITVNSTLTVQLLSISGGSGSYTSAEFSFEGETLSAGNGAVTFATPETKGTYPLTLTIEDSEGKTATFTQQISVVAYAAPTNLTVSDITRNGFLIAWDQPLSTSITAYKAKVEPAELYSTTPAISPTWKEIDDGFQTAEPIDLSTLFKPFSLAYLSLTTQDWSGALQFSTDNGQTWQNVTITGTLTGFTKGSTSLLLKTTEATPPKSVTLTGTYNTVAEVKIDATGERHLITIDDLPAGETYSVTISAYYKDAPTKSSAITVTLLSIPTFKKVSVSESSPAITFTWPDGDEALHGYCQFVGKQYVPGDLAPGLYLSRVYKTAKDSDTGLTTGKAIAITNTSQNDIHLDGSYIYFITHTETKKTYDWDFSVEDEDGENTYPYTVPAGGELIFYYPDYAPLNLSDNAIPATKLAVKYITTDYTLSLEKDGDPCNSLTPVENAVVRLKADPRESETHAITSASTPLDALYTPWNEIYKTVSLGEVEIVPTNGQCRLIYSNFIPSLDNLLSVEAHAFLTDGTSQSETTIRELYKADLSVKPGFLLRLH